MLKHLSQTIILFSHTIVFKSQLSADYIGIIGWPQSITDGSPDLIIAKLHSSLIPRGSIHQSDVTISAEH